MPTEKRKKYPGSHQNRDSNKRAYTDFDDAQHHPSEHPIRNRLPSNGYRNEQLGRLRGTFPHLLCSIEHFFISAPVRDTHSLHTGHAI